MRTNKEIIQIAIDNFDMFETGLCFYFSTLYYNDILNIDEVKKLDSLVRENIVKKKWYNILFWYKPNFIEINEGVTTGKKD